MDSVYKEGVFLYSIMLVDDEAEIRDGIQRKIDWAGSGFTFVGSAENGQEALELAESLHPDVVMTDIKMPFMDGLTLGRHLAERFPGVKLVFFSGFDDFEYAQKAIQIGAAEYILKPVSASELTGVLQKLRGQLDAEFAEKRDIERLRSYYERSLPALRGQFVAGLLDGRIPRGQIAEQAALYGVQLVGTQFTAALAGFESDIPEDAPIRQRELLQFSVKQLMEEALGRRFRGLTELYNGSVAVIAGFDDPGGVLEFISNLDQVCKLARRFLQLTLTVGVGTVCDTLFDLHYSMDGARSALDYRVLIGTGRAIYIDDIEPDAAAQIPFDEQDKRELLSAIKLGAPDTIRQSINRFIGRFYETCLPIGQYQLYLMELTAELVRLARAYQLDTADVFGPDFAASLRLEAFDSLDELKARLSELCLRISELIRRERSNSTRGIAEGAKQFIAEHFSDPDISVEMLCDHLHVSPAYFSTLFKKETGMSFVAWLTNVRMDEAVKLLSTTEDKTYEISLKVGYTEPNYFSYVFKKQFGMSPTKYRGSRDAVHA